MRFAGRILSPVALTLAALLAAAPAPAAQEAPQAAAPAAQGAAAAEKVDLITPHITDGHHLEYPCFSHGLHLACSLELPRWEPIHLGPLVVDLSPTKHVVMLLVAALLAAATLITAAVAHRRHHHAVGRPKGFAAGIEAMVLYLRNEVILPNVGHHGQGYVPFVLTIFFFILFANLLGLVPFGATATGNIAVTGTLAIIAFIAIEVAGMRAQGAGYIKTIVYWPHDMPLGMKLPMTLIMTPVEIIGKFTKPFALAIRLFANMTAGHIVVLAFIGLFFGFAASGGFGAFTAVLPLLMAVAIMLLELFVAFLQAFIFTLLTSVFIGQIREGAH
jgi:F-type H+-transporting ATPase subunit a